MDPITIVAVGILLAMTIYLVGFPLFRREEELELEWEPALETAGLSDQEAEKRAVFTALAEIEFDYQMGKMSENDYRELKEMLQPKAVELLQQEEKAVTRKRERDLSSQIEEELEKELERELAEIRRRARQE